MTTLLNSRQQWPCFGLQRQWIHSGSDTQFYCKTHSCWHHISFLNYYMHKRIHLSPVSLFQPSCKEKFTHLVFSFCISCVLDQKIAASVFKNVCFWRHWAECISLMVFIDRKERTKGKCTRQFLGQSSRECRVKQVNIDPRLWRQVARVLLHATFI